MARDPFKRENKTTRRKGGGRDQRLGNWVLSNTIAIDQEHKLCETGAMTALPQNPN